MSLIDVLGTIIDPKEDGNMQWKVPGNKQICSMSEDYYCESPPFYFLRQRWCLRFYPNGDINNKGFFTVHLHIQNFTQFDVPLTLNISLKLHLGNVSEMENRKETATHTFSDIDQSYVWGKIIRSDSVWKCKPDSCAITISCFATLGFLPVFTYSSMCRKTQVSEDLKNLFLEEEFTDVTFKFRRGIIKAHKLILQTRSAKLKEMFQSDEDRNLFLIKDCEPDAFKMFLQFLYTGMVENLSIANAISMYEVAFAYSCEDLKRICTDFMINRISKDTSSEIFTLACKYTDKRLAAVCSRVSAEKGNQSNPQGNA